MEVPAQLSATRPSRYTRQSAASPHTDSTSRYRSPPHSAKPSLASLASLPRLTASVQAPFGHALKGYTSSESPTASGPSWFEGSSSETVSDEAQGQAQTERSSRHVSSAAASPRQSEPVRTIKTKYGRDYERQHDRLPFEPVLVPMRAEAISPRASTGNGRDSHVGRTGPPQQSQTLHRHVDAPISRDTKDHIAAEKELAGMLSEKQRGKVSAASSEGARSDNGGTEWLGGSAGNRSGMPHPEEIERAIGRHRARNPALGIEYTDDASLESMRRSRAPGIVIRDAMQDEHPPHSAAPTPRKTRKVPTPWATPEESTSEGEGASQEPQKLLTFPSGVSHATELTASTTAGVTKDEEKREKRRKRREKRKLVSALKKPGQPSPFISSDPTQPSPGGTLPKSVAFGDIIPAEVGGSHIPPPHNDSLDGTDSTAAESTAAAKSRTPSDASLARSREPSPDPAQLGDARRKRRSRHKDRPENVELDTSAPPLPFDFSRFDEPAHGLAGSVDGAPQMDFDFTPGRAARQNGMQTTVDDGSDDGMLAHAQPAARRQRDNVLELPPIPEIDREYDRLPGLWLVKYFNELKGSSVYSRVRDLIYDYHADLEDINKRRARFWLPLAEGCEALTQKIRNSLYDGSCKRKVPAFHVILGSQDDPEENTIQFARRAVTEQIKQAIAYTTEAMAQYNGIIHSSDEIFSVGGDLDAVDKKVRDGFVHAYWGLSYQKLYFTHLFNEIALITWLIRKIFEWLHAVPSASELQLFPQDKIEYYEDAREQLVEWLDHLLAAIRLWKSKVTRQNFEKQLVVSLEAPGVEGDADDPRHSPSATLTGTGRKLTTDSSASSRIYSALACACRNRSRE